MVAHLLSSSNHVKSRFLLVRSTVFAGLNWIKSCQISISHPFPPIGQALLTDDHHPPSLHGLHQLRADAANGHMARVRQTHQLPTGIAEVRGHHLRRRDWLVVTQGVTDPKIWFFFGGKIWETPCPKWMKRRGDPHLSGTIWGMKRQLPTPRDASKSSRWERFTLGYQICWYHQLKPRHGWFQFHQQIWW